MMQFKSFHWLSRHGKSSRWYVWRRFYISCTVGFYIFRAFVIIQLVQSLLLTNPYLSPLVEELFFGMIVRFVLLYLTQQSSSLPGVWFQTDFKLMRKVLNCIQMLLGVQFSCNAQDRFLISPQIRHNILKEIGRI